MFKRNLLSVLALGTFVALATGSEESETSSTDDWVIDVDDGTTAPSGGETVEITSKDLSAEYDKNEIAADNKFKGKTVKVTGKVEDIGKDFMDEVYITLEGQDIFQGVQVYFKNSGEEETAATLEKGQDVTIEGNCDGLLLNVQIEDAVFVD
jgi:hypothetical protein